MKMNTSQQGTETPELIELAGLENGILRFATMQELYDQLALPIWLYDRRTLRFVHANRAALDVVGYTRDELTTYRVPDLMPAAVAEAFTEELRQAPRLARRSGVWTLLCKGGHPLNLHVCATDMAFSRLPLTLVSAHAIPDQEHPSGATDHSNGSDEVSQRRMRLAATTGHELRSPLNVMVGYAELIAMASAEQQDSKVNGWAETIVSAGASLQGLITDMLDRSRLDAGEWTPRLTDTQLEPTIRRAVESVTAWCTDDVGLRIELAICANDHRTDSLALSRIVANLVGNALKYTDEGYVTLTASCTERGLQIDVADTGIGIAEDDLPRLFVPFERGTSHKALERPGSGVGLSIVHDFVERLGGSVAVASTPGVGTRFSVSVPVHHAMA